MNSFFFLSTAKDIKYFTLNKCTIPCAESHQMLSQTNQKDNKSTEKTNKILLLRTSSSV